MSPMLPTRDSLGYEILDANGMLVRETVADASSRVGGVVYLNTLAFRRLLREISSQLVGVDGTLSFRLPSDDHGGTHDRVYRAAESIDVPAEEGYVHNGERGVRIVGLGT